MDYRDHASLYRMFEEGMTAHAARVAYRSKKGGTWHDFTWGETRDTMRRVAKSLLALGVSRGDRVAVLSSSRLEWVLCDLGVVSCGGATVGIYPSNLAADCRYLLDHSEAAIAFVENQEQMVKIREVRADLPRLRQLVVFDGPGRPEEGLLSWSEFLERGAGVSEAELERRGGELRHDDLASIVYTSGTTGVPKGAMITHGNLLFASWSAEKSLSIEPHYGTLMFLPLAHVFARLILYCCLRRSLTMAFAEDITTVAANLKEIRPQFIASVPRIYEKVYDKVLTGAEQAGGVKLRLFQWALGVGSEVSRKLQSKEPIPAWLGLRHALAKKLVLHKIPDALGGRLAWAVSGAAPLNKTVAEFFHACGVTILEGIGMTENTSFSHVNRLDNNRFGTVGQPGPGVEQRIAADGELLTRGPNVMRGYFKSPEATAETIDAEGWLHTGDIGEIDSEGFLRITDRKKELIITAGGKNVAPQRIEQVLRESRYIAQAVAQGDRRKFIGALVTLDPDNIRTWAREHGLGEASLADLAAHPQVRELIGSEVERCNRSLASFESVKRFHILPRDLTIEHGELTASLKIKRKVVGERYRQEIEALFTD